MKAVFGILAILLVSANALDVTSILNICSAPKAQVDGFINEGQQLSAEIISELELQSQALSIAPLNIWGWAIKKVKKIIIDDTVCVIQQARSVEDISASLLFNLATCGTDAARTSIEIVTDTTKAVRQLGEGGYDVLQQCLECRKTTGTISGSLCKAKLSTKLALYVIRATSSISTLKNTKSRVQNIAPDADTCVRDASSNAVAQVEAIPSNMLDCIKLLN